MISLMSSPPRSETIARWRRQIGHRHRLADERGPRPFAVVSYFVCKSRIAERYVELRQLWLVSLSTTDSDCSYGEQLIHNLFLDHSGSIGQHKAENRGLSQMNCSNNSRRYPIEADVGRLVHRRMNGKKLCMSLTANLGAYVLVKIRLHTQIGREFDPVAPLVRDGLAFGPR